MSRIDGLPRVDPRGVAVVVFLERDTRDRLTDLCRTLRLRRADVLRMAYLDLCDRLEDKCKEGDQR